MDVIKILEEVVLKFAASIAPIMGAIIITLIGWIIAKIIAKAVGKLLEAIKIDDLASHVNETEMIRNSNFELKPSAILPSVIYYLIMLITLIAATGVLQIEAISKMMADLMNYIPNLFIAVLLLVLAIVISDVIKKVVLSACQSMGIPSGRIIAQFVFYLVFITLAISALDQAKIATDLITANLNIILGGIMAAFAIGYGLASKDTMANFMASYYTKNKFSVGDTIGFEGVKGKVVGVDTTSVSIKTENSVVIIPLKRLTSEKVEIF